MEDFKWVIIICRSNFEHKAVELLLANNARQAKVVANSVNYFNDARKNIDRTITQDALRMLSDVIYRCI